MEFKTYKEARDQYPNESEYKILKLGDKKYIPVELRYPDTEINMEGGKSDFFNKKIPESVSLYGDVYESIGDKNERQRYLITKTGNVKLISGEPVVSKKDLKTGEKYSTTFRNPGFMDLGNITTDDTKKGDRTGTKNITSQQPMEDLTFGQTYALPPEYVNALAQMSLGQKGNNKFKRQVIAGNSQALGGRLGGGTTERSAGNFLGAIAQGISESVADNAQKWSSSETGKADFWNRIVPALESATGRKIMGLSPEQQQAMNTKYHELQIQKQQAGEPITDEDYQKLYRDAMVQGTKKGLTDQALKDFSTNYAKQTWMKQMNEDDIRKQAYEQQYKNTVTPIDQQMSLLKQQASENTGNTITPGNPDVNSIQQYINSKQAMQDKFNQMLAEKMALAQYNQQNKIQLLDIKHQFDQEMMNGGNGQGAWSQLLGFQTIPTQQNVQAPIK